MVQSSVRRGVACCVFATDSGGEIQEPQSAWAEYTGQHFSQYLGSGWFAAVESRQVDEIRRRWAQIIGQKKTATMRVSLQNAAQGQFEKTIWLCTPLSDRDGSARHWIITISREPTDSPRRRREKPAQSPKQSFQPTGVIRHSAELSRQLFEDIQTFHRVASHDLRAPLRKIRQHAEQLFNENRANLSQDAQHQIDVIVRSTKQLKNYIEAIQSLTSLRTEPAKLKRVSAAEVLDVAMRNLGTEILQTNARITALNLPTVLADPDRLLILFEQLLSNAIVHRGDQPVDVRIDSKVIGSTIQIRVLDSGTGMGAEHREKIFQAFRRGAHVSPTHGFGVGLALCKLAVESMGGTIELASDDYHTGVLFRLRAEPINNRQTESRRVGLHSTT